MANQVEKRQVEEQAVENAQSAASVKAMKRGTVIQAVKAIAVLVCICLVCGILLALCNDLFYISDEERFNRSMAKIYPELDISAVKTVDIDSKFSTSDYGEVKSVVTDGEVYILEAKSAAVGFDSGTVTLYVIVDKDAKIVSWVVKEHTNQSYIDKVPSNAGTTWYVGKDVSNALDIEMTGATVVKTSTAIQYAVNAAAYYCRSALGVGKNPEADSKTAILALLGDDYSAYTLNTAAILTSSVNDTDTVKDAFKVDNDEISYIMYADGDKGLVKAYVYGQDADTQKIVAFAGDEVKFSANLAAGDAFVTKVTELNAQFNVIESNGYTGFGYVISAGTPESTVYSVSGIQFGTYPGTYVLNVTIVGTDGGKGEVSAITITTNGFMPGEGAPTEANANVLATKLVGATIDNIEEKYGDKAAGATESANLIRIAVETALRHYDASHASND